MSYYDDEILRFLSSAGNRGNIAQIDESIVSDLIEDVLGICKSSIDLTNIDNSNTFRFEDIGTAVEKIANFFAEENPSKYSSIYIMGDCFTEFGYSITDYTIFRDLLVFILEFPQRWIFVDRSSRKMVVYDSEHSVSFRN